MIGLMIGTLIKESPFQPMCLHCESSTLYTNLGVMLAAVLISCMFLMFRTTPRKAELIGCISLSIAAAAIYCFTSGTPAIVLCNLLLVGLIGALIACGIRRLKPALINTAIVFLVFDIIARYFDMFYSMLDRSLFFVLGGIILIVVGTIAERNRRTILQSFN